MSTKPDIDHLYFELFSRGMLPRAWEAAVHIFALFLLIFFPMREFSFLNSPV